jgi:hypothetical protein
MRSGSPRSTINPVVQIADLVGDLAREAHLVRRDQHRHALGLELADRLQHLADELGIERARDLVEQQRAGTRRERAGDRDALLLAAREPVGVVVLAPLEPEAVEQLARAPLGLGAALAMAAHRRERDVLERGQVREEVERLEHHPEPAAHRDRLHRRVGDHLAVQQHVAVVDLLEQVDAAQQRRLARPRGADQRDGRVLGDLEVDPAQHRPLAVRLRDAADLEHGAHSRRDRSQRSSSRASGTVTQR